MEHAVVRRLAGCAVCYYTPALGLPIWYARHEGFAPYWTCTAEWNGFGIATVLAVVDDFGDLIPVKTL
jgi:hypothetical protein